MEQIYTWKINVLADESVPWQHSLPSWPTSLCFIFFCTASIQFWYILLSSLGIHNTPTVFISNSSNHEFCPTRHLIKQSHTVCHFWITVIKQRHLLTVATGIKRIANRCKAKETYKGNWTGKIRSQAKSNSQKQKEGNTRTWRLKCCSEVIKPEPKSTSQRCCLGKSM